MEYMVALGMLSTALKDLAVEMRLFVMSSTQTNAKSDDDQKGIKNESVIRGSRAIIDKCDIACVASRVSSEEQELLADCIEKVGIIPNQVTDVYKVRRGRYTNVRIWSDVDLGTCRKKDLFITDDKLQLVPNFETVEFSFNGENTEFLNFMDKLNAAEQEETVVETEVKTEEDENIIDLEEVEVSVKKAQGIFGDLL